MVSYKQCYFSVTPFNSLNPTFNGRWFHMISLALKAKKVKLSLNPTFNGRWFHINEIKRKCQNYPIVLILLLMEDGFI